VPPITDGFKRLSPAYKAIIGLVAPIGTIIGMLLALNVIQPFGSGDAFAAGVEKTSATTAAIALSFDAGTRSFDAKGDVDYTTGWSQFHYDYAGGEVVDVRQHRRDVYVKLPGLGKRSWVHADLDTAHDELAAYAKAAGLDAPPADLESLTDLDFTDPSQALAGLRRATDVKKDGDETIFGIPTHRYDAVVEPRDAKSTRLAVTAWIDDNQLIRRLHLQAPGAAAPFAVTLDFLKFGDELDIRAPRAAQVMELKTLLLNLPAR
jgi:hypothetical protein